MKFIELLVVYAVGVAQALKLNNDSHHQHTFGNGTDVSPNRTTHKCLNWQSNWQSPELLKAEKQIYFFDIGTETGQTALLALGKDPHQACQYNKDYAQTGVPKNDRSHECIKQAQKSLKFLKDAQREAAKHMHRDLFIDGKVIMVEPSPAYSPVIKTITEAFPHRTQSYERAITGFDENDGDLKFSVANKSIDPYFVKKAEQKGAPVVNVKGLNLMQLLSKTVTKDDFVIVKMDVEGAEFEVLPCLVASSAMKLIDVFLVERHDWMPIARTEGYVKGLDAALEKMEHNHIMVRSNWP